MGRDALTPLPWHAIPPGKTGGVKMKRCTSNHGCNKWKPIGQYHDQKTARDGKRAACRECTSKYNRQYKAGRPAEVRANNAKHRDKRKLAYIAYTMERGSKCEVCGNVHHTDLLDFHHVNPANKKFEVNTNWRLRGASVVEGGKCAMLCANCHRWEHHLLREGNTSLPEGYTTPDGSTPVIPTQEK